MKFESMDRTKFIYGAFKSEYEQNFASVVLAKLDEYLRPPKRYPVLYKINEGDKWNLSAEEYTSELEFVETNCAFEYKEVRLIK